MSDSQAKTYLSAGGIAITRTDRPETRADAIDALAAALRECDAVEALEADAHAVTGTVRVCEEWFPEELVFGHNDLHAANFIDDGDRIWLIDWEYAGFNSVLYDLGGFASNNELDAAEERRMIERYYRASPGEPLLASYAAMKCASVLRDAMWGMVSELHSGIDFDYVAFTEVNLERFERVWHALAR